MTNPEQALPSAVRSREEIARIEVGHTSISPGLARAMVAGFLVAIAIVPIVEWIGVRNRSAEGTTTAWSHLLDIPREIRSARAGAASRAETGVWARVVGANRTVLAGFSRFERTLDDESVLGRALRQPAQRALTTWLGAGNERVYPGRDGWVFYRPDVEYVTSEAFLRPARLQRRVAAAAEWETPMQPDPREALAGFKRDLDARGITLVLVPTPLKPGVHPEMLSSRFRDAAGVLQNPSFDAFVAEMRRIGVLVFDPAELFAAARRAGPQYLATDTHWRPEAMEAAAEGLAVFLAAHVPLPAAADTGYRVERLEVRNLGDTSRMLELPDDSPLFPPEDVWLRRVLMPDGSPWRSARDADVLVLGDSFSNIYALESMGWGTSAGFVEQLSFALRRPVDRLVQNDEGAFATRAMLQRDPSRLDGKRVVVYQFAVRELAFGDWKVLPLPRP
jgi:hypothetical protein